MFIKAFKNMLKAAGITGGVALGVYIGNGNDPIKDIADPDFDRNVSKWVTGAVDDLQTEASRWENKLMDHYRGAAGTPDPQPEFEIVPEDKLNLDDEGKGGTLDTPLIVPKEFFDGKGLDQPWENANPEKPENPDSNNVPDPLFDIPDILPEKEPQDDNLWFEIEPDPDAGPQLIA